MIAAGAPLEAVARECGMTTQQARAAFRTVLSERGADERESTPAADPGGKI
jgi:hypothetical protein